MAPEATTTALVVHHLHVSQSERIPWLCEELGIPYDLKTYDRTPVLAPPELKALHPQGTAPIIQEVGKNDDVIVALAESGACIEYICHTRASGALFVPPTHPRYADFVYWWHYANGSFQPAMSQAMMATRAGTLPDNPEAAIAEGKQLHPVVKIYYDRVKKCLATVNSRLESSDYLAGPELTAADIMIVFSLTTYRTIYRYSLHEYPHILGYLRRVGAREGYRRAMDKCEPGKPLNLDAEPNEPAF